MTRIFATIPNPSSSVQSDGRRPVALRKLPSSRRTPRIECLESRRLFAGNISVVDVYLVDPTSKSRLVDPAPGTHTLVRADLTVTGIPAGTDFRLDRITEHGTLIRNLTVEAGWAGKDVPIDLFSWTVLPGHAEVKVKADPENDISETAEGDNQYTLGLSSGPWHQPTVLNLPIRHSFDSAPNVLFLDFDGHYNPSFSTRGRTVTPAFDRDGNPASFNTAERTQIEEIWKRVSEDFAPFDVDVTTEAPAPNDHRRTARMIIGGSSGDWYIDSAGGVATEGGLNTGHNTGYAFITDEWFSRQYEAMTIAETASHETGHLLSLKHQSEYDGNGQLVAEYAVGDANWSPLMGAGFKNFSTWSLGPTPDGPNAVQDDLAIITRPAGFPYRDDDHGPDADTATVLTSTATGIIERMTDVDYFVFQSGAGTQRIKVQPAALGPNLSLDVELRTAAGVVLRTSKPGDGKTADMTANVPAGTYYVVVKGTGEYGRLGQYTVTASTSSPRITVTGVVGAIANGQSAVDFGSTLQGSPASALPFRTFTVTNAGDSALMLGVVTLPAGFVMGDDTLVSTLTPGATDTFTVRLDVSTPGSFGGDITIATNDPIANPFRFAVAGEVQGVGPDLAVTAADPPAAALAGSKGRTTVVVANAGTAAFTGPVTLTLHALASPDADPAGSTPIATRTRRLRLQPDGSATVPMKFVFPEGAADASYHFVAVVDAGAVVEATTANNVAGSASAVLVAAPFVNLAGIVTPLTTPVSPGKKAVVRLDLTNSGNVPARGTIVIRVVASTDASLSVDDRALDAVKPIRVNLKPGATRSVRVAGRVPLEMPAGTYSLFLQLDAENTMAERDETDNTVAGATITIVASS